MAEADESWNCRFAYPSLRTGTSIALRQMTNTGRRRREGVYFRLQCLFTPHNLRYLIEAGNCISLWAFLPLHDIEFNFVAFFEAFVSIELNCRIVDEDIRTIVTADESIAFRVVEPFDLAFIGSHEPCLPPNRSSRENLTRLNEGDAFDA